MTSKRLHAIVLLVIVSSVSWRKGTYYAGGVDAVVAVKALLSLLALGLAFDAVARAPRPRRRLGSRSIWFLAVYLSSSVLGAAGAGDLSASGVLAVRMSILAATVFLLLRIETPPIVVRAFVVGVVVVAVAAGVTGASTLATRHRLSGGIPPLAANEVALLCAIAAIYALWRGVVAVSGGIYLTGFVVAMTALWLTGSRTGLLATVVGLLFLGARVRRWPIGAFLAAVAAIPAVFYLVGFTGALSGFFERGGSENVATLSARTVAWSAAEHLYTTWWSQAFGGGLSVRKIPVAGQWWNTQILDSSWISALVQAGLVGVAVMLLWTMTTAVAALRSKDGLSALWPALIILLLLRSVLESGLLDATPAFALFFLVSVASDRSSDVGAATQATAADLRPMVSVHQRAF